MKQVVGVEQKHIGWVLLYIFIFIFIHICDICDILWLIIYNIGLFGTSATPKTQA